MKQSSSTSSGLHPRVVAVMRRSRGPGDFGGGGDERKMSSMCKFDIGFPQSMIDGLDDQRLIEFFQNEVAPRMMDFVITARDVSAPADRGGSFECTVGGGRGVEVSCTGKWTF